MGGYEEHRVTCPKVLEREQPREPRQQRRQMRQAERGPYFRDGPTRKFDYKFSDSDEEEAEN